MSNRKRRMGDVVYDTVYAPFNNNPAGNRMSNTERMYVRILSELALNRFKWIGLPDTVDERFLELTLFNNALCVFYFDESVGRYLALRGTGGGVINMYDNPTKFTVIGNSMIHRTLTSKECVPIWANFLRSPDKDIVFLYAQKLAHIDRTIDINLDAMRHNYVITCDESERNTFVNILRQHREGQPAIFGTNQLDMSKLQTFDVGVDKDIVLNLQISKSRIWNECMTLLGINNANQDKRERLVASEVEANDEQVVVAKDVAMQSRDIASEQINRMFGLTVSVGWNPNITAMADNFVTSGLKVF